MYSEDIIKTSLFDDATIFFNITLNLKFSEYLPSPQVREGEAEGPQAEVQEEEGEEAASLQEEAQHHISPGMW